MEYGQNVSFFDFEETTISNNTISTEATMPDPMVSLVVPAVMFAAGVIGNGFALFVLARSPAEQKKTVFYRLAGGLVATDLFGTCATSPITLLIYSNNLKWLGGQHLCNYFSFMLIYAGLATIFILGAMALDRYFALNKPYIYVNKISCSMVKYILLTLWALALVIASLPLVGLGANVLHYPQSWCFFDFYGTTLRIKLFAYLYSCIGILVILTVGVFNIIVIRTLIKMRKMTKAQRLRANVKSLDTEIQMVFFLMGILCIFSICWAPLMVRIIVLQMGLLPKDERQDLIFIRFASFNQILDPWVYILFRKAFIVQFIGIIKSLLCSKYQTKLSDAPKVPSRVEMTMTTDEMVTLGVSDCSGIFSTASNIKPEHTMLLDNTSINDQEKSALI